MRKILLISDKEYEYKGNIIDFIEKKKTEGYEIDEFIDTNFLIRDILNNNLVREDILSSQVNTLLSISDYELILFIQKSLEEDFDVIVYKTDDIDKNKIYSLIGNFKIIDELKSIDSIDIDNLYEDPINFYDNSIENNEIYVNDVESDSSKVYIDKNIEVEELTENTEKFHKIPNNKKLVLLLPWILMLFFSILSFESVVFFPMIISIVLVIYYALKRKYKNNTTLEKLSAILFILIYTVELNNKYWFRLVDIVISLLGIMFFIILQINLFNEYEGE